MQGILSLNVHWRRGVMWFFFSSRRRHTRCGRDWSSDVCSSDLHLRTDRLHEGSNGDQTPAVEQLITLANRFGVTAPGNSQSARIIGSDHSNRKPVTSILISLRLTLGGMHSTRMRAFIVSFGLRDACCFGITLTVRSPTGSLFSLRTAPRISSSLMV